MCWKSNIAFHSMRYPLPVGDEIMTRVSKFGMVMSVNPFSSTSDVLITSEQSTFEQVRITFFLLFLIELNGSATSL